MTSPPGADVLAEFGVTGRPQPLAGGQRTVWRVDDLVFKALDSSPELVAWQGDVLRRVGPDAGVRVAPPVPSTSGAWVVQGWTAWPFLAGRAASGQWHTIIAAGRALHLALRGQRCPPSLLDRDDVWARADRAVWDLAAAAPRPELASAFDARRPLHSAPQLVHGDLTGNVLVHRGIAPAVVDFSPYWRPPAWAAAVVCADALLYADADLRTVLDAARAATGAAVRGQVLLRGVLFRLVTAAFTGAASTADAARVLDVVVGLANTDQ